MAKSKPEDDDDFSFSESAVGKNLKNICLFGGSTAINVLDFFLGTPDITTNVGI